MSQYALSNVIKEYIIETLGDSQMNRFARYYTLGVSFLRENSYDMSGEILNAELEINDDDTADLPADYGNYVKIGLCGKDGNIYALGRNDNLCLDKVWSVCGIPVKAHNATSDLNGTNIVEGSISLAITPE